MQYQQALAYIHSFGRFGKKPGLENIQKLMEYCKNPQEKLRCIHIAGTNGKGSTAVMASCILQNAGYKTGLYISPFVIDFRERFQINKAFISEQELSSLVEFLVPIIDELTKQGYSFNEFEINTAIAFLWFANNHCDIVCLETGIGGRFDATNVITSPAVSVITSISYDHTAILGDTLEKIAFEKCGIIKQGGVTVTSPGQDPEALAMIMKSAAEKANRLIIPGLSAVTVNISDWTGSQIQYGKLALHIPFAGKHQIANALTAIEAVNQLSQKGFCINNKQIENGIAAASFPARQEIISKNPLIILDGCHNPSGIMALADTVAAGKQGNVTVVMGMLKDKNYKDSVKTMSVLADTFYAVTLDNPRAASAEDLLCIAKENCACVAVCPSIEKIIELAQNIPPKDTLILCGSLFLAAELRKLLLEKSHDVENI